jgi:hypothetical protein
VAARDYVDIAVALFNALPYACMKFLNFNDPAANNEFDIRFRRAFKSSCMLLAHDKPRKLRGVGSGVLFAYGERKLLLTACHVLQELRLDQARVSAGKSAIPLQGKIFRFVADPTGKQYPTNEDIGWIELTETCAQALEEHCTFLEFGDIDFKDTAEKDDFYTVIGAPGFKSKYHPMNPPTNYDFVSYTGVHATSAAYLYHQRSLDTHILLEIGLKQMRDHRTGKIVTGKYPRGVSGGGVFTNAKATKPKQLTFWPKLVGIFTDYYAKGPYEVMIGTYIGYYLQQIEAKYGKNCT